MERADLFAIRLFETQVTIRRCATPKPAKRVNTCRRVPSFSIGGKRISC